MAKVEIKTRFFEYDEASNIYKCKEPGCSGRLKDIASSLKRHIAQKHPEIAEKIGITGYKRKDNQQPGPSSSPAKRIKMVTVPVDTVKFQTGIIQMVSQKSISFNFFNSEACGATIGILAKAINMPVYGEAVAAMIPTAAKIIQTKIAEELGNFFCLEFDGAARHNRKIFGINVRTLKDGNIITRTLSMMEITEKQTAINLKNVIERVLERFNTDVKHVYSCTSDNGRNMIKCTQELHSSQQQALSILVDDSTDEKDEEFDDPEDYEHEEIDSNASEEIDEMLEAVEKVVLSGNESCICSIKCAAHTINLVAKDAVDADNETLKKIRKLVKTCRKIEYSPFFLLNKIRLPKGDVETRWGSQFGMMNSFYSKKNFYIDMGQKFPELLITEEDWSYIEEYTVAFEPLNSLTTALQSSTLILGDVFKLIKMCQLKLSHVPVENRFIESLKQALEKRTKVLMDNDAFRAAMLFDQRWCFVDSPYMSTEDKLKAIEHVLKVSNIAKTFNTAVSNEQQEGQDNRNHTASSEDAFEAMLEEECQRASTSKLNPSQIDLKVKLLELANSKIRLPSNTDILKYWESRRYDDEELYKLAMIVLCASATQVSVERCFSGIKLLLENHRLRMSPEMLDDLMTIRYNSDLLPNAVEVIQQMN